MDVRILIADDHRLMREGLCALIDRSPGMKVIAQAESGRQAVELSREFKPDIVIMDINMPDLNGMDAARLILKEQPDLKIIAVSIHSKRQFVIEMLKSGASGYLPKNCAFEELENAIRVVSNHQHYLSPQITGIVLQDYVFGGSIDTGTVFTTLTLREREVLQLVAEGLKTDDIASRLFVSAKTISFHRNNIMEKLGLKNMAELIRYAIKEGLVSVD